MRFKYERLLAFGTGTLVLVLAAYAFYEHRQAAVSLAPPAASLERLRIPSIGVDASIEKVALTPDGAMDTPDGPSNVGWYSPGPYPGEQGSAVIAGHRGWKDGVPAVFDDLDKMREGDVIHVTDPKGKEATFVVRETRRYPRDSVVPEVFASTDDSHLNLITCVGAWDSALQSSEERLVVFADLVP
ncbi:MAG TPA: class F sortase [Candidatus Paceibacterota bacterium]|jgi:LPXTG-site transpeptidase (sortase) family protein